MINDEELIKNVESRVAYQNSQKEFSKLRNARKKFVLSICSLALVCALTLGVDAATNGAISSKFKAYIYNIDGTKEEMPVEVTTDEKGREVYKFSQHFTQNGEDYTVEGEYYDCDGTIEFGETTVLNEDGTVNEEACVITYAADSEEEADEFQKLFGELAIISDQE